MKWIKEEVEECRSRRGERNVGVGIKGKEETGREGEVE